MAGPFEYDEFAGTISSSVSFRGHHVKLRFDRLGRTCAVAVVASSGVILVACGGGSTAGTIPSPEVIATPDTASSDVPASPTAAAPGSPRATLSGVVVKGPVANAAVCAYALTLTGKGTQLSCTTTDSAGRYSMTFEFDGPVVVDAAGGSYLDEATGMSKPLSTPLMSVSNAVSGQTTTAAQTAARSPQT